jgi:hypothetical protein
MRKSEITPSEALKLIQRAQRAIDEDSEKFRLWMKCRDMLTSEVAKLMGQNYFTSDYRHGVDETHELISSLLNPSEANFQAAILLGQNTA